jgi:hypothetical protein
VTTQGVGWASEEASDLVATPLNLVIYMHLRIFAYTSNVLIASFEYVELMKKLDYHNQDNQGFHHDSPKFSNSPNDSPDQALNRIKI